MELGGGELAVAPSKSKLKKNWRKKDKCQTIGLRRLHYRKRKTGTGEGERGGKIRKRRK